jgi:hypothetical protein
MRTGSAETLMNLNEECSTAVRSLFQAATDFPASGYGFGDLQRASFHDHFLCDFNYILALIQLRHP